MKTGLSLTVFSEPLAICRLPEGSPAPVWMPAAGFKASLYTPGEVTLVCEQKHVPPEVRKQSGWRAIQVQGPLDFSQVGVLAALSWPLAEAGVSIFVLSTFDTDYVLVKETALDTACQALQAAGHTFLNR